MAKPAPDFQFTSKDLRLAFVWLGLGIIGTAGSIVERDWWILLPALLLIVWPGSLLVLHFRHKRARM